MNCDELKTEIPAEVLSSPALLFLYHRIEQILGIKTTGDAIIKLNEHLEKICGASFIENPAAFEKALTSREQIFDISKTVTINETYFFREGVHFNLLASLLPQLIKLKRPIQICSAATSIGCEAYSIAMLLDYHAKKGPAFDFAIDAFDINADVIETAKNARYTANTLRADGAEWKHIMDSYLIPDGDQYLVSQDIRSRVRFFPLNIMRGLDKKYDIIFFRNALIYFTSKNRLIVLDDLAGSLFDNGLLFLGVSETSTVKHPLLESRYLSGVFYFQKTNLQGTSMALEQKQIDEYSVKAAQPKSYPPKSFLTKPFLPKSFLTKRTELPINCREIKAIFDIEEGQPNAKKILENIADTQSGLDSPPISGSDLAAAAAYFLSAGDFNSADLALLYLEKTNACAHVLFLRGEYHLLRGSMDKAKDCFENAAGKDRAFWPAFYRIASSAAEENPARYEYKIKKASESIQQGRDFHYECFMGGFSPDYFERILTKKLSTTRFKEYV
ncbi:MAG: hypothetical protein LBC80_07475 [Treponema sp.]|jgi:chemotaxis protein methyltransferase CheR|nr:hypothetical protein [Treponema sp.]